MVKKRIKGDDAPLPEAYDAYVMKSNESISVDKYVARSSKSLS